MFIFIKTPKIAPSFYVYICSDVFIVSVYLIPGVSNLLPRIFLVLMRIAGENANGGMEDERPL